MVSVPWDGRSRSSQPIPGARPETPEAGMNWPQVPLQDGFTPFHGVAALLGRARPWLGVRAPRRRGGSGSAADAGAGPRDADQ